MTSNRKCVAVVLLLAAASLLWASGTSEQGVATDPITLRYSSWLTNQEELWNDVITPRFQEQHPEIEIEFSAVPWAEYNPKLQTQFASGTGPHAFDGAANQKGIFIEDGIARNIQDWVDRDIDLSEWYDQSTDRGRYYVDGDLYGFYTMMATGVLYYNKTMFDEAGLAYPDDSWTTDDLLEAAIALTIDVDEDNRIDQWGFLPSAYYWFYSLLPMFGGSLTNSDITQSTVDSVASVAALQFDNDLFYKHQVSPPPSVTQGAPDLFFAGRVAMSADASYRLQRYNEVTDFEWDMALLPSGPNGRFAAMAGDPFFIISTLSDRQEEAWTFVRWYLDNLTWDMSLNPGNMPAKKAVAEQWLRDASLLTPANVSVIGRSIAEFGVFPAYRFSGIRGVNEIVGIEQNLISAIRLESTDVRAAASEAAVGIQEILDTER